MESKSDLDDDEMDIVFENGLKRYICRICEATFQWPKILERHAVNCIPPRPAVEACNCSNGPCSQHEGDEG